MNQKELLKHFDEFAAKARKTIETKNADYANSDALSNFKLSAAVAGLRPEEACLSQIGIKVSRLGVLLHKDTTNHESVEDNVMDLFNYSFLLAAILEDKHLKKEPAHGKD